MAKLRLHGAQLEAQWSAAFLFAPDPPPKLQLRWTAMDQAEGRIEMAGLQAPLKLARSGPAQIAPPEPPSLPLDPVLVGTWVGRYELGGVPRQVTLTLAPTGSKLLIVGKRRTELAIDEIHLRPTWLRLQARAAGVQIEGGWSASAIDGRLTQGPFEATLPLRRGAAA